MFCARESFRRLLLALFPALLLCSAAHAAEPHWIRLNSSHFSVVTNASQERGKEVIVRFEQMRSVFGQLLMRSRVNLPEPMEIIALASEEDYSAVVPGRQAPLLSDAFFVPGEDRYYFVLNLSRNDSWRAVSYDFAKTLLNYNYPPVQPWFDEGFAQYFSSLLLGKSVQIGGEPESSVDRSSPFIPLLSAQPWIPAAQLFALQPGAPGKAPAAQAAQFEAQSWIVMHFLINQNKLEQTGNYFDLAQNQKLPPEQAIQQAYAMSAAQFDQAVKSYWQSLIARLQAPVPAGRNAPAPQPPGEPPTVISDDEIGSSMQEIPDAVGQALVAEMALRLPEHRNHAIDLLNSQANQPKLDNVVAHRALAFSYLQKNQFSEAAGELSKAAGLDARDPWLHFYAALIKYHQGQATGHEIEGLANMMQDLHAVIDWNPEFAEGYNMLGLARVEGGGITSAMQTMRTAMQLSPRNQQYQLNMAKIYIAARKFDAANAILIRLTSSSDPRISQLARQQLSDLPALEKYGVAPQTSAPASSAPAPPVSSSKPVASWAGSAPLPKDSPAPASSKPANPKPANPPSDDDSGLPPQPEIDKRPLLYLKGRLVSVDCSHTPMAIVTVSAGTKRLNLRTEDFKSLTLIGVDEFSCDWSNRAASANYRAGGKSDGDLVSLELY
jgi:tetratricopeptide (TPR) repeat protein